MYIKIIDSLNLQIRLLIQGTSNSFNFRLNFPQVTVGPPSFLCPVAAFLRFLVLHPEIESLLLAVKAQNLLSTGPSGNLPTLEFLLPFV